MSASKKHEETLRRQAIDFDQPGTILRDFQTLLDFIGPEGVRATGKYHFLPLDRLFELDEKMSKPLRPPLERPQQRSFPALHGLYLLLRTTQLAVPDGSGRRTGKLVLNPFMLAQWESLNPTERYFNLLEAWLLRSSGETIGKGHARWGRGMFFDVMHCWTSIPKAGSRRRKPSELSLLAYSTSRASNLALLEMFGAVDLELGRPVRGQTWPIRGIRRTEFGEALFEVLFKSRRFYALLPYTDELSQVADDGTTAADADGESDEAEECGEWGEKPRGERDFGVWQRWFQPYFPEWQKNLRFQEAEFREGVYYFMVTLGSAWRRIAVPARHTLESLAWAILDAFEFEEDHLYDFRFTGRDGVLVEVTCPEAGEGDAATDEFQVGYLPLEPGQSMLFLFDYGDEWHFDVKLEKVEPPDPRMKKPKVIERHGKAPKQYDMDW